MDKMFTPRQESILEILALGIDTKTCAEILHLSSRSVEKYLLDMYVQCNIPTTYTVYYNGIPYQVRCDKLQLLIDIYRQSMGDCNE